MTYKVVIMFNRACYGDKAPLLVDVARIPSVGEYVSSADGGHTYRVNTVCHVMHTSADEVKVHVDANIEVV